ncbi:MAG: hypothetical protein ACI4IF_02310 [Acutalibacteraceae bacterium]
MNIKDTINRADKLLNNSYSEKQKIDWLAELDGRILKEVYVNHETLCDFVETQWIQYLIDKFIPLYESAGKDIATIEELSDTAEDELLLPMQYQDIYVYYLLYKYTFHGGERERAEYYAMEYNGLYEQFTRWVTRTYKPIQKAKITG